MNVVEAMGGLYRLATGRLLGTKSDDVARRARAVTIVLYGIGLVRGGLYGGAGKGRPDDPRSIPPRQMGVNRATYASARGRIREEYR